MGILDELIGGGQRQKEYRDFVDRYQQGDPSEGYSAMRAYVFRFALKRSIHLLAQCLGLGTSTEGQPATLDRAPCSPGCGRSDRPVSTTPPPPLLWPRQLRPEFQLLLAR